jgi:hypothetical protein
VPAPIEDNRSEKPTQMIELRQHQSLSAERPMAEEKKRPLTLFDARIADAIDVKLESLHCFLPSHVQ